MRIVLPVMLVLGLLPARASAVTVQEIVSLTKAGVSEPVILALIERDKTIFTIVPEQLVTLKKEGVTDAVLVAMLRSGREEPLPQQPASPPPYAFPAAPYSPPEPNVVVVGSGPDRPNTGDAYYGPGPYAVPYVVPVPVPYPVPVRGRFHRGVLPVREFEVPLSPPGLVAPGSSLQVRPEVVVPPATGIFFTAPARGIFFNR
jgi:hypothetical protein